MNRHFRAIVSVAVLTAVSVIVAFGQSSSPLTIHLAISAAEAPASVTGTLTIRNTGDEAVTVKDPRGWMVSAFLVLNSLGNVVMPEGIAKVHSASPTVTIAAHSEYRHTFRSLEFLTGSMLFGYTITTGETYRVVAVYRPNGRRDEAGVTSSECIFTAK